MTDGTDFEKSMSLVLNQNNRHIYATFPGHNLLAAQRNMCTSILLELAMDSFKCKAGHVHVFKNASLEGLNVLNKVKVCEYV